MSAGITLVYSLGAALHWSSVCIVCGAVPVAIAGCMTLLPETPNWLANNGRQKEALEASMACLSVEGACTYDVCSRMRDPQKADERINIG